MECERELRHWEPYIHVMYPTCRCQRSFNPQIAPVITSLQGEIRTLSFDDNRQIKMKFHSAVS